MHVRKMVLILVAGLLLVITVIAVSANLVANPGFEVAGPSAEQARHWTDDQEGGTWGSAVRSDWQSQRGEYAAAIRGAWSGADYGGFWQTCPVVGGARYTLSAAFMWDNDWEAQKVLMRIEWYKGDEHIGQEEKMLRALPEARWTRKDFTAAAPLNATHAHIAVDVSGIGTEGVMYVDEVQFEQD